MIVSGDAPRSPFMCGSATLAIVVSSTCMIVASMIADGDQPAMRRRSVRVDRAGFGHGFGFQGGLRRLDLIPRLSPAERAEQARRGCAGRRCRPRRSALMPVRSAQVRRLRRRACSRTGMRCVTFTQLPVAFCAGSSENSAPVPAPMLVDRRLERPVGIGVEPTSAVWPDLHVGQLRFLEVRLDPGVAGLDQR